MENENKKTLSIVVLQHDLWGNIFNNSLENPMDRGDWWATVHGVAVGHNCVTNTFTFQELYNENNKILLR